MSEKRRRYQVNLIVNGKKINIAIIDPHYEAKHSDVINDDLILKLIKTLEYGYHKFEIEKAPFQYYVNIIESEGKPYRLIWLLEDGQFYIGIRNAFRSSK